jgi:hypothetical protein
LDAVKLLFLPVSKVALGIGDKEGLIIEKTRLVIEQHLDLPGYPSPNQMSEAKPVSSMPASHEIGEFLIPVIKSSISAKEPLIEPEEPEVEIDLEFDF